MCLIKYLITDYVANLLSPGYGASVCSYSWGEMRVISNLSVLGDAAGIAAAYCYIKNRFYSYVPLAPFNLAVFFIFRYGLF